MDDEGDAENGEAEKLSQGPKMMDASTSMSTERLSVMVKQNQVRSLTSLSRGSRVDIESLIRRRSSYTIVSTTKGGSASKVKQWIFNKKTFSCKNFIAD